MTTLATSGLLAPLTAAAIRAGLSTRPLRLPFEVFYDEVGSALFDAITQLPEYGLTRAERRLLDCRRELIALRLPPPVEVVELGSGSGRSTRPLLEAIARRGPTRYDPVDISNGALQECLRHTETVPGITVRPFQGTHEEGLAAAVARRPPGRALLVLFLGSNIGNFEPVAASHFLQCVQSRLRPGDHLLLGGDLVKPEPQMVAAYDDPAGVTAAFNRNALGRLNRELGADFRLPAFGHCARYDPQARRVEMHLVALDDQRVRVDALDLNLQIAAGETIWTESSHKYLPHELVDEAEDAGFELVDEWTDREWPFALSLLAVPSPQRAQR